MKGHNLWSYAPYKPFFYNVGDIYIARVVPDESSILLQWLNTDDEEYDVYYHKRGDEQFIKAGTTKNNEYKITNLEPDTDYEFYVQAGERLSRTRLAKCAKAEGTVVNYLHPDDEVYAFSGRYLCSPSLVRHPEGFLLASMDLFDYQSPQNLTLIFRSDDNGATWYYVSELMPCFWGKMFIHKGDLYMLGCSTEYGDLIIGKSTDGGKTFCAPVTLLRGSNGKKGNNGVHKNPQNVMHYKGRIYETLEWGTWWSDNGFCHAAMVMSCDENADLMNPENWSFTEPRKFDRFTDEMADLPMNNMTIEGTLVVDRDGQLLNVMRFGNSKGLALAYSVDTENPHAMLEYSRCIEFPAHLSKFMIKYDAVSDKYYSIASRLYDKEKPSTRNLLSLMASDDLNKWEVVTDLLDYRHEDYEKVGFQYVDFEFEGDDIIYLCRTAMNGANSFHDSNYSTFHTIKNFRNI